MHRSWPALVPVFASLWAVSTRAADVVVPRFDLPDGFAIELVAGPSLIAHPLMAGFDERGRLYVSDAAGVNLDDKELDEQLPNRIRRLEDSDGDGRFDRATTFADRMTFPNGAAWLDGALYVASAPYIWRLRDRDDDGVAEERAPLVGTFGFIGNAADIHGCFVGPEGRLWWCDGRHGHEIHDVDGKLVSRGEAARIFSCKPDGTDVRVHCGGGMDNPVEIDFTPSGDVLGTVNLFYQTRGDCLVHWLHGGRYPREDQPQCLAEFPRTGDLLGPALDYGHVAVSGMMRYRSGAFGPGYADAWFVCEFNTHQVNCTRLERDGATYVARREEFLRGDSIDFHPTDVLEDADGSLLVIDTGGWFRYGCPTSQVAKPEIAGAIYRIRHADMMRHDDPRGNNLAWRDMAIDELGAQLSDPRWVVRERAQAEFVRRGEASLPALLALEGSDDTAVRLAALWTMCRIGGAGGRLAVRERVTDSAPEVRQSAANCAGWLQDAEAAERLLDLLHDSDGAVRRSAAMALGRINDPSSTPALLDASAAAEDRAEEHAAIFALLELRATDRLVTGLRHAQPSAQRAALLALDQTAPDALPRDDVLALLASPDPLTAREAIDAISRRPEWSAQLHNTYRRWLSQPIENAERAGWLRGALAATSHDDRTQALIAELLSQDPGAVPVKQLLLDVIGSSDVSPWPDGWIAAVSHAMQDGVLLHQAVAVAAQARDERLAVALNSLATRKEVPAETRAIAVAGIAALGAPLGDADLDLLLSAWTVEQDASVREGLALSLGRAHWTERQLLRLASELKAAQPLELAALLPAFRRGNSADTGRALAQALRDHAGLPLAPLVELRAAFDSYPSEVRDGVATMLADREVVSQDQQARLGQFDARREGGDELRGHNLFFGTKAACAACHRVGTQGGRIGPDLSRIGQIRSRRDLGEAILYPSLSLARGYDTFYTIATTEGLTFHGLVERESGDAIYLRTTQRELVRLPRDAIEELVPSRQSIMPQGFDELLTEQELDDVVAYLLSLK